MGADLCACVWQLVDLTRLSNHEQRNVYVLAFQALRLVRLVRLFLFIKVLPCRHALATIGKACLVLSWVAYA